MYLTIVYHILQNYIISFICPLIPYAAIFFEIRPLCKSWIKILKEPQLKREWFFLLINSSEISTFLLLFKNLIREKVIGLFLRPLQVFSHIERKYIMSMLLSFSKIHISKRFSDFPDELINLNRINFCLIIFFRGNL